MYPPNRYPCLEQILCLSESNIYIYISSIRFQTFSLPPFCSRACTYIKYFSKPKVFLSMKETAILFKVGSGGEENREHGRPWTCLLVSMASRWHPSIPPFRSKENRCGDSRRCYLDEGVNRKSVSTIDRVERMIRG